MTDILNCLISCWPNLNLKSMYVYKREFNQSVKPRSSISQRTYIHAVDVNLPYKPFDRICCANFQSACPWNLQSSIAAESEFPSTPSNTELRITDYSNLDQFPLDREFESWQADQCCDCSMISRWSLSLAPHNTMSSLHLSALVRLWPITQALFLGECQLPSLAILQNCKQWGPWLLFLCPVKPIP